jgi:hypothetical protein
LPSLSAKNFFCPSLFILSSSFTLHFFITSVYPFSYFFLLYVSFLLFTAVCVIHRTGPKQYLDFISFTYYFAICMPTFLVLDSNDYLYRGYCQCQCIPSVIQDFISCMEKLYRGYNLFRTCDNFISTYRI